MILRAPASPAPFLLTGPGGCRHSGRVKDAVPPPEDAPLPEAQGVYSKFETELQVRPDDIDMYQHVHSSRYMDYVLAARFDQMERCYRMPMAEFQRRGYGWFMAATQMNFKRPLGLGDRVIVRTWIERFTLIGVKVQFQIERAADKKLSCDGWFDYVMVSMETARAVRLPEDIRAKYAI
jgi:YbgC/YbaW family acyl-CoA thioester hydrolase